MRKLVYKITHPFIRLYWRIFKPKTQGSRALIFWEKKILLVKNINSPHWSLPGGKMDDNESAEDCLVRELREELDLSLSSIDSKLGTFLSEKEGKRDTIHIFVIRLTNPQFKRQWELQAAAWFDLHHLPEEISPAAKRRINEYLTGQKTVIKPW